MADEGLEYRGTPTHEMRGAQMGKSVFHLMRAARGAGSTLEGLNHPVKMPQPKPEALPFHMQQPNWGMPK